MSSSGPTVSPWFMVGAAVVGVVGAAGMIIAEHFRQEKRRQAMAMDLQRLDQQVLGLQGQLEVLQKQKFINQSKTKSRRHARSISAASVTSEDYNSALDMDSSDLEFYDINSGDDDEEDSIASTVTPYDMIVKDVDAKLNDGSVAEINSALDSLKSLCVDYPDSPELLYRMGRAHYKMCMEASGVITKLDHINIGLDACSQAIALRADCGESHKWFAILMGVRSDHQPLRQRILDSMEFKKHLDIALTLLPEDPTVWHLLGRYAIEIAGLKWYEKKAVAALCSTLPECTYEEAIERLMTAERLGQKDWKENKLALAKCHIGLSNYKEAIKWLEEAERIPTNSIGENIDAEIKTLLSKYSSYR